MITATRLSVIFEKSMYALRMFDRIGRVISRISTIFMSAWRLGPAGGA